MHAKQEWQGEGESKLKFYVKMIVTKIWKMSNNSNYHINNTITCMIKLEISEKNYG